MIVIGYKHVDARAFFAGLRARLVNCSAQVKIQPDLKKNV